MPEFLNIEQAADHLHVPVSTMNFWRLKGTGPEYRKIGKRVFYLEADLLQFADSRRMTQSTRKAA